MVAFLSLAPRASLLAVSLMQPITMIFFSRISRRLSYQTFCSKSCDAMWNSENTTKGLGIGVLQQACSICSPVLISSKKSVSNHGAMDHPQIATSCYSCCSSSPSLGSQTQQSSAWLGAKLCTILQDRDAMHLLQVPERLSQVVPLLPKAMMNLGHNTTRVNRMM
jgi:hypothetical protein